MSDQQEHYEGESEHTRKVEKDDSTFQVLTEYDQQLLEESTRNVMEEIAKRYPDELPDAVLLPDTSGRVLAYDIDPIFKKLAPQRGFDKTPALIFFKVQNKDYVSFDSYDYQFDLEMEDEERTPEEKEKQAARKLHDARAEDILEKLRAAGIDNPEIIIIDEYASEDHATIMTIRNAFRSEDMPAFPLMARIDYRHRNDNIYQGVVDPKILAGELSSAGFDFRVQQHEAMKKPEEARSFIGVTKRGREGSMYSERAENTSGAEMKALRHDMRLIGEKISEEIE